MELVIKFSNRRDYQLFKELASRMNAEIETSVRKKTDLSKLKGKFKSEKEFRKIGGMAKGQLVNKAHLRNLTWKKR